MSDFVDMLVDMLPLHSELQKTGNQVRQVLDNSVGEYMDAETDIFDQLFLTSASGSWLDVHGRDYGVFRRDGETDESYRERIVFEKLEYLTARNLQEIYGLTLYCYVASFDPSDNDLTSDNPYACKEYMCYAEDDLQAVLERKFILGTGLTFLEED